MICEIIVDVISNSVDKVFDYFVPDEFENLISIGKRVQVYFGGRKIIGYVIKIKAKTDIEPDKIKPVMAVLDENPVITEEQIFLMEEMCRQFHLRKIDSLKLFLPPKIRNRITVNKRKVYNSKCKKMDDSEISSLTVDNKRKNFKLTPEQKSAIDRINNEKGEFLLFGVTGSGKTEVYLNTIENILSRSKTAIMLVPEISLTPQIFERFKERFGDRVAIIHSGLSDGERYREWEKILKGEVKIVVGARSAIFAPLSDIGLIIMDEEHDSSYVSDNNPRFITSEIAVIRAKYNGANIVYGSATPGIETYFRAKNGEIGLISMPSRVNSLEMPNIKIVNMTEEILNGNAGIFSRALEAKLDDTINRGKQSIIFINRRGYSSFVRCITCGNVPKCTDCDVSLTLHKEDNELKCHYCGKKFKVIKFCPECGGSEIRQGGVGTERVCERLAEMYPDTKIFRMDQDTTKTKDAHQKILEQFKNSEGAILVGTQMIAKGHDFPDVNFVGIVDSDLSLYTSDYKSAERTFQLISQVSGRSGRFDKKGDVVLQTYNPRHFVYKFASEHNYKAFYEKEINLRETTQFPPFSLIMRLLVFGENEKAVKNSLLKLYNNTKIIEEIFPDEIILCKPMKSPVKRAKNKYRYQILIRFKTDKSCDIINTIYKAVDSVRQLKGVSIFVEINPQNLS